VDAAIADAAGAPVPVHDGAGADSPAAADAAAETAAPTGAELDAADASDDAVAINPVVLSPEPPQGLLGPPAEVGCADGSREGFTDLALWPNIAACSGGFSVVGLQSDSARRPHCDHGGGNTGGNPFGVGCAATDLCAEGWQVCEDAGAVARYSTTGCDGAATDGFAVFFLVRAGASPDGICIPGAGLANDLHGCGSWGLAEHSTCGPLDRRLDFVACAATQGLWSCGDGQVHLQETAEVSKTGSGLGGVLCCKPGG
jgi:hypothetical protein